MLCRTRTSRRRWISCRWKCTQGAAEKQRSENDSGAEGKSCASYQKELKALREETPAELMIEAFAILLQHRSFLLNAYDFQVGISTCGKSAMWPHACWLLSAMPKAKINPDVISYSAAAHARRVVNGRRH
eukprot:Skav201596  [mRNA]  locus=scaffold152:687345:687734:+ [translate_table: standard]